MTVTQTTPCELAAHNSLDNVSDTIAYLGRGAYNNDAVWCGEIDEFSLWEGVFSDSQVAASFARGSGSVIPEPSTYAIIFGALTHAGLIVRHRFRKS